MESAASYIINYINKRAKSDPFYKVHCIVDDSPTQISITMLNDTVILQKSGVSSCIVSSLDYNAHGWLRDILLGAKNRNLIIFVGPSPIQAGMVVDPHLNWNSAFNIDYIINEHVPQFKHYSPRIQRKIYIYIRDNIINSLNDALIPLGIPKASYLLNNDIHIGINISPLLITQHGATMTSLNSVIKAVGYRLISSHADLPKYVTSILS
jgi:hypothetical protein